MELIKGGDGATGFGELRYTQHQTPMAGTNEINTYYPQRGGRRGGTGLEPIAVPATLLIANTLFRKKGYTYPNYKIRAQSKRRGSRRSQRSRRRRGSRKR